MIRQISYWLSCNSLLEYGNGDGVRSRRFVISMAHCVSQTTVASEVAREIQSRIHSQFTIRTVNHIIEISLWGLLKNTMSFSTESENRQYAPSIVKSDTTNFQKTSNLSLIQNFEMG